MLSTSACVQPTVTRGCDVSTKAETAMRQYSSIKGQPLLSPTARVGLECVLYNANVDILLAFMVITLQNHVREWTDVFKLSTCFN